MPCRRVWAYFLPWSPYALEFNGQKKVPRSRYSRPLRDARRHWDCFRSPYSMEDSITSKQNSICRIRYIVRRKYCSFSLVGTLFSFIYFRSKTVRPPRDNPFSVLTPKGLLQKLELELWAIYTRFPELKSKTKLLGDNVSVTLSQRFFYS